MHHNHLRDFWKMVRAFNRHTSKNNKNDAQKNDKPVGISFLHLIQRLSLSVQRSNVHMITSRIGTLI
jgi:hypothetical protein